MQALAEPGAIYVTRAVRDHLREKSVVSLEDLGELELKKLPRPIRTFRARFDMQAEMPPVATTTFSVQPGSQPEEANETELVFWNAVSSSSAAADYEAYLDRFPDGVFAKLASSRLDALSNPAAGQTAE